MQTGITDEQMRETQGVSDSSVTNKWAEISEWAATKNKQGLSDRDRLELSTKLKVENIVMVANFVLVKKIDEKAETKSGIILAPDKTLNKNFLANDTFVGEVLAVWPECRFVKPGDIIYGNKFFVKGINIENITTQWVSPYGILEEKSGIACIVKRDNGYYPITKEDLEDCNCVNIK